jgi:Flp pilus assembly protein TadG
MITAIFGVMDCSRALFVYHFVSYAAQEGTRYAIVRGSQFNGTSCATTSTYSCDATAANIQSFVRALAPPGEGTVTVNTTWPGTQPNGTTASCSTTASVDGCLIQVRVSVPFSFVLSFLPKNSMTFTGTSVNVVQQ